MWFDSRKESLAFCAYSLHPFDWLKFKSDGIKREFATFQNRMNETENSHWAREERKIKLNKKRMLNTVKMLLSLVRAVRLVSCLPFVFWFITDILFQLCLPFLRDLFVYIVLCFFWYLTIMMRQLFKSRHIHALVKRPGSYMV